MTSWQPVFSRDSRAQSWLTLDDSGSLNQVGEVERTLLRMDELEASVGIWWRKRRDHVYKVHYEANSSVSTHCSEAIIDFGRQTFLTLDTVVATEHTRWYVGRWGRFRPDDQCDAATPLVEARSRRHVDELLPAQLRIKTPRTLTTVEDWMRMRMMFLPAVTVLSTINEH